MPGVKGGSFLTNGQSFPTGGGDTGSNAYQTLYNRLVGSMTLGNVSQQANGANWGATSQNYYNNGGGFFGNRQQQHDQREDEKWTNRILYNTNQQKEEDATYHEANGWEKLAADLQDASATFLENMTGFSHNRETYGALNPKTIGSFVPQIFLSQGAALGEVPAGIMEVATGKNVTEHYRADDGTLMIKDEDLNGIQRGAQAFNTAVNAGSGTVGASGDLMAAGTSMVRRAIGNAGREAGQAVAGQVAAAAGRNVAQQAGQAAATTAGRNAAQQAGRNVARGATGYAAQVERTAERTASRTAQQVAADAEAQANRSLGQRILEDGPFGIFNRRAGGMRAAEGRAMNPVAMIASGAAEEGAEEAAQSFAEDIRRDELNEGSLGRALEGAAWGALGGGIMGSAAAGIQSTFNAAQNTRNRADQNNQPQTQRTNRTDRFMTPRTNTGRDQYTSAFNEFQNREAQRNNEQVGAITAKSGTSARQSITYRDDANNVEWTSEPGLNNGDLSYGTLQNLYDANPEQNARAIAATFGLDENTVRDIFFYRATGDQMRANISVLRNALHAKAAPSYFAYGRNPKTSEYGGVLLKINDIVEGDSVHVHQLVHENFKDDVDGDNAMIGLIGSESYRTAQLQGTASRQLHVRGRVDANVSYDYSNFRGGATSTRAIRDFVNAVGGTNQNSFELLNLYNEAIRATDDDARANAFTAFFTEANNIGDNAQLDLEQVDDLVSRLYTGLQSPLAWTDQAVTAVLAEQTRVANEITDTTAVPVAEPITVQGQQRPANTQGRNHASQLTEALGLVTGYVQGSRGNPPFRQLASMSYGTHGIDVGVLDQIFDYDTGLVPIIASLAGLRAAGAHPEMVVSGLFRSQLFLEVRREFLKAFPDSNGLIHNNEQWREYQVMFARVNNKLLKTYGDAVKDSGLEGEFENLGRCTPNEITINDNGTVPPAEFSRAFNQMFSGTSVDTLFSLPDSSQYNCWTLFQLEKHLSQNVMDANEFNSMNLDGVINTLMPSFESTAYSVNKNLMTEIEEKMVPLTTAVSTAFNRATGELDQRFVHEYVACLEFISSIIDPKAFETMAYLGGRNSALASEIGQRIFTATTKEEIYNGILEISLATDYANVIDLMDRVNRTDNQGRKQQLAESAINYMARMQTQSPMHRQIFFHALQQYNNRNYDGMTGFLDRLMDPTNRWDEKVMMFTQLQKKSPWRSSEAEFPLLVYALANGETETDITAFSTRHRRASSSLIAGERMSREFAEQNLREFENAVSVVGDDTISLQALRTMGTTAVNEISRTATMTFLVDNLDVAKPYSDKGTVTQSQAFLAKNVENRIYGGEQSLVTGLTDGSCGMVDLSDFWSNSRVLTQVLFQPGFSIQVNNDIQGNGKTTITLDVIMQNAGVDKPNGNYDIHDYIKIFRRHPNILSHLGPTNLSANMVGSEVTATEHTEAPVANVFYELVGMHKSDRLKTGSTNKNTAKRLHDQLHRNLTEQVLSNSPKFYGLVFHMMPDLNTITDSVTLSKELNTAWDKAVDFIYNWSNTDPNSEYNRRFRDLLYREANFGMIDQLDRQDEIMDELRRTIHQRSVADIEGGVNTVVENQVAEMTNRIVLNLFNQRFNPDNIEDLAATIGLENVNEMLDQYRYQLAFLQQQHLVYFGLAIDPQNSNDLSRLAVGDATIDALNLQIDQMPQGTPQEIANRNDAIDFVNRVTGSNGGFLAEVISNMRPDQLDMTVDTAPMIDFYRSLSPNQDPRGLNIVSPFIIANVRRRISGITTDFGENDYRTVARQTNDAINLIVEHTSEYRGQNNDPLADYQTTVNNCLAAIAGVRQNGQTTEQNINTLLDFLREVNAELLDFTIRESKGDVQVALNEHGGSSMISYLRFMDDAVAQVRRVRTAYANSEGYERYSFEDRPYEDLEIPFPQFNFTSSANAFAAQNAIVNSGSAGAADVVSINGRATGECGGVALVPREHACGEGPDVMTLNELRAAFYGQQVNLYDGVACHIVGEDGPDGNLPRYRRVSANLFNSTLAGTNTPIPGDTQIEVYTRGRCRTGTCARHDHLPGQDNNWQENGICTILARIIKYAKEGMALRLKKNLNRAEAVVRHIERDACLDISVDSDFNCIQAVDPTSPNFTNMVMDLVGEYRHRLSDYMFEEMDDRGFDDITRNDCDDLSAFFVNSVEVRYGDGTREVVSLEWLLSDDRDTLPNLIQKANGQGVTIKVNVTSAKTISAHMVDAVQDWLEANNYRVPTEQELDRISAAFCDWAGYTVDDYNTISIDYILNGIGLMTPGVNSNLKLATSETPGQRWARQIHPQTENIFTKDFQSKPMSRERARIVDRVSARSGMSFIDEEGRPLPTTMSHQITAAFGDMSQSRGSNSSWARPYSELVGVTKQDPDGDSEGSGFVIVLTDRTKGGNVGAVAEAWQYCKIHNKPMLLREDLLDRHPELAKYAAIDDTRIRIGSEQDTTETFVIIDTEEYYRRQLTNPTTPDYETGPLDVRQIFCGIADCYNAFDLADSDMIFSNSERDRVYRDETGSDEVPLQDFFRQHNSTNRAQICDFDSIMSVFRNPDLSNLDLSYYTTRIRDIPRESWIEKFTRYCDELLQNPEDFLDSANGCFKTRNVHPGDCIGLLRQRVEDRYVYAPIFFTKSGPKEIDVLDIGINNNEMLEWSYNLRVNPEVGGHFKYYGTEANKHIASVVSRVFPRFASTYSGSYKANSSADAVHYIRDGQSDKSRSFGRTELSMAETMFYDMQIHGGGIFFRRNPTTGEPEINSELEEYLTTNNPSERNIMYRLITGETEIWRGVASGRIHLAQNDAELNEIYRDLASRCLDSHVNPQVLFSPIILEHGKPRLKPMDTNVRGLFNGFSYHKILRFFHHMDIDNSCFSKDDAGNNINDDTFYCPDGEFDPRWTQASEADKHKFRFNDRGCVWIESNGVGHWYFAEIKKLKVGEDSSVTDSIKSPAKYGFEQKIMDWMAGGIIPSNGQLGRVLGFLSARNGYATRFPINERPDVSTLNVENPYGLTYQQNVGDMFSGGELGYLSNKYMTDVEEYGTKTYRYHRNIVGADGKTITTKERQSLDNAISLLNDTLQMRHPLTEEECIWLYQNYVGWSHTMGETDSHSITVEQFCNGLNEMRNNISNPGQGQAGLLIVSGVNASINMHGSERVMIPLLPEFLARKLYTDSREGGPIRRVFNTFNDFRDAMLEETEAVEQVIEQELHRPSKKQALCRLIDYNRATYHLPISTTSIIRDSTVTDRSRALLTYQRYADADPDLADDFAQRIDDWWRQAEERCERIERSRRVRGQSISNNAATRTGSLARTDALDGAMNAKVFKYAAELRKANGVLNPLLAPANFAGRMLCGGSMWFALRNRTNALGQLMYDPGIVFQNHDLSHDTARMKTVKDIFKAMKAAAYSGNLQEFMLIKNEEDLYKFIDAQKSKSKGFKRAFELYTGAAYKIASCGDLGIEMQIQIFFERFAQLAGTDVDGPGSLYAQERTLEDGRTFSELELALTNDPIGTIADMFAGPAGSLASQAWNFAMQGDMAQRNIVSEVYSRICQRFGIADFFVTSFISPYFTYATNLTGRVLSGIAPMSTFHYLIVNMMSQNQRFADWNLQDIQTRRNLKEAVMADVTHMGFFFFGLTVAAMAVTVSGLLEPPEDDDKIVNPFEWTFCGFRINSAWWLSDILGPAVPFMCSVAATLKGKFQYAGQILVNGVVQAAYNNPMFSVSSLIDSFFDGVSEFAQGTSNVGDYSGAPGGQPTVGEALMGAVGSGALNYFSQFITPSFVKEMWTSSALRPYELSYKKAYVYNPDGSVQIDPDTGEPRLRDVSYAEAQIRKVTRNNPFLGFIVDGIARLTGNTAGYNAGDMPPVYIVDPLQSFSSQQYSLFNEDGTEKSEVEKQAIALEIINTLNSTDDMEALCKSGFYVPYETKKYVGEQVAAVINQLQDNYDQAKINGEFNYKNYGDYDTVMPELEKVRQAFKDEKDRWETFLYDKLWSDPMKQPMVAYNRINTTYAQDANGNWYATGFERDPWFGILPIQFAEGDLNNPGDTMGREGDWATRSALDPSITTGERGLVPVAQQMQQTPDYDLSGTGNANNAAASTNSNGGGYPRGGYGYRNYGGGYYRRSGGGGGGGGGGRPSIRSFSPSLYLPTAQTMNTSRYYGANFDYLRPGFETKGSREASKREDF